MPVMPEESPLAKFRYLILDDDSFSRTVIRTALSQFGVRNVSEANNAIKAIEILKNEPIDVILVDQEMPGITGLEFAQLVRRGEEGIHNVNVPIIVVTVNTAQKTVLQAKSVGVQEYIVKPVSPIALKKRLEKALRV